MLRRLRVFWVVCIAGAGIALGACNKQNADTGPPKPVIAASIFPLASLVGQLTDGWAEVVTLLPEGASVHAFEMTDKQTRQLSRADLLIVVGNGVDSWAEPKAGMTGVSKQPTIVRMCDLIGKDRLSSSDSGSPATPKPSGAGSVMAKANPPLSAATPASTVDAERDVVRRGPPPAPTPDAAGPNKYIWLDPVLAKQFVDAFAGQLSSRYPQHRGEIEKAAARLSAELQDLDQRYREKLSTVRRRELITFDNAFDLIAHRYGLVVVARLTDTDSDPHGEIMPDSFLAAIKAVNKYGLMAIYSEPQFSAQEVASIQRETAVEVLSLDPLGGPTTDGYRTCQQMMESNLKTLVRGQGLETMAPPDLTSLPTPPSKAPAKTADTDWDLPLKLRSTAKKKPKAKDRPNLFSDPDLSFPRTVPTAPDHPATAPSPTFPVSPFQP